MYRPPPALLRTATRLLLLFLLPALLAATLPALAASPAALTNVTQSHTIAFGREITVSLRATSDSDIVSVVARYRPRGPDRISVYAYPEFTPGRTVNASFSIRTGDGAYFPPGTEFDYHFELTDAQGRTTSTEPRSVEYLDPRFEWKRKTAGSLTAVYHNISDATVSGLLDRASADLPALAAMIGVTPGQPFKAVLYRTVSEATAAFPRVSETATDRQFFAGFAQPEYGLFVLGEPVAGSFVHELTHLLVGQAVSSPLAASVPSWLNEGLAVLSEGETTAGLNSQVSRAARSGDLLKLRSMGSIPGRRDGIALFYPQSGAFVAYLRDRFGPEGLASLLAGINGGLKVHDAALASWGVSLDDIEKDWRVSLGAGPLPTPSPAPGTPGPVAATPLADVTPAPSPAPVATPAPEPVRTVEESSTGLPVPAYAIIAAAAAGFAALVGWRLSRVRRGPATRGRG